MGCINVEIRRHDVSEFRMSGIPFGDASVSVLHDFSADASADGYSSASAVLAVIPISARAGLVGVSGTAKATQNAVGSASIQLVCDVNRYNRYLEINPEIVWVLDGWASNDVYSNTMWLVN